MTAILGKGVIEVAGDTSKLTSSIKDAKRSINSLGDSTQAVSARASASIDRYVRSLEIQQATLGMTTRETELYKLSLRGANAAQLAAADSALRLADAYRDGELIGQQLRAGFLALGVAAVAGIGAAAVAFDSLIKKAGDYQDAAEKIGDSATSISQLSVAAAVGGVSLEGLVGLANKLTKNLTGVDDESKAAGAAIRALGLDIAKIKDLSPTEQIRAISTALAGFEEGAGSSAVAIALFGKAGAESLPFLRELGNEVERQTGLTDEQIRAADDYADAQARFRAELTLSAQSLAIGLLPLTQDLTKAISDLAKDTDFASTATEILRGALRAGIAIFQTIAIVASDVGFVLRSVGNEIGGIAAQIAALARGDLSGFNAISQAMKEDAARARAVLDRFQQQVLAIGTSSGTSVAAAAQKSAVVAKKPKLAFEGAVKKGTGKSDADQVEKAAAAARVDDIKAALEQERGVYANDQRELEALRAAGLVNLQDYYTAKKTLLELDAEAQQSAIQAEIDVLSARTLSGAAAIENERKVAELSRKLEKSKQDAASASFVLSVQEGAALQKVAKAYSDAEAAAQSYVDSLVRANKIRAESLGKGEQERNRLAGRATIEDRFSAQRDALARDRASQERAGTFGADAQAKYDDELSRISRFQVEALRIYDEGYKARIESQQNWVNGALEGLQNYYDQSQDISKQTEQLFVDAFKGMEDALVNFVTTGKLDFASLANSIIADITRIIIKQQIMAPLLQSIQGGIANPAGGSGGGVGGFVGSILSGIFGGRASGGAVSAGGLYQVNERGPELLNVAGKQFLMMGNNSGSVTPNGALGGNTVNLTVNQTFAQGTTRATTLQAAADARRQLEYAGRNL